MPLARQASVGPDGQLLRLLRPGGKQQVCANRTLRRGIGGGGGVREGLGGEEGVEAVIRMESE